MYPLVGDVDNGGGCAWGGVDGKSPHLPLDVAVNLELLYKNKVLKNIYIIGSHLTTRRIHDTKRLRLPGPR